MDYITSNVNGHLDCFIILTVFALHTMRNKLGILLYIISNSFNEQEQRRAKPKRVYIHSRQNVLAYDKDDVTTNGKTRKNVCDDNGEKNKLTIRM